MTKVSVVLYYWILIAAVLLFTKTAGLAENNEAVIKIIAVATILYVGLAMISRSRGKALEQKDDVEGDKKNPSGSGAKRKKKNKKK